jgi:hypothetical protein
VFFIRRARPCQNSNAIQGFLSDEAVVITGRGRADRPQAAFPAFFTRKGSAAIARIDEHRRQIGPVVADKGP